MPLLCFLVGVKGGDKDLIISGRFYSSLNPCHVLTSLGPAEGAALADLISDFVCRNFVIL